MEMEVEVEEERRTKLRLFVEAQRRPAHITHLYTLLRCSSFLV